MIVQYMKEEEILRAISGHINLIDKALQEKNKEAVFNCLRCGGKTRDKLDESRLFIEGDLLPNYYKECVRCLAVFNPSLMLEISPPKN